MPLPIAKSNSDPQVLVDMNTTPLIDVMLVLLIMLIITIPVQLHSVNLNLPTPSQNQPQKPPEVVQLQIQAAGNYVWNGEPVASADELQSRLHAIATRPDVPELHIKPEKQTHYKYVATALAGAQREGLTKLGIVNSAE